MRWSLSFLFFCMACQSRPATENTMGEAQLAKVTREAPATAQAQYDVRVLVSPRRHQEIEAGVLGHPEVRKCLDLAAGKALEHPNFVLEGRVAKGGEIEDPRLSQLSKGLELCLTPALKALNLGKGRSGRLKMQIHRRGSKNQIKKFE